MYYYSEKYYDQIKDVAQNLDLYAMSEDATIQVEKCVLQPIVTLNADIVVNGLESELEERYSENDGESEFNQIKEVLKRNIDFKKINSELPRLWYRNNVLETYTKSQLIAFL